MPDQRRRPIVLTDAELKALTWVSNIGCDDYGMWEDVEVARKRAHERANAKLRAEGARRGWTYNTMTTRTVRVAIIVPRRTIADRLRGDRCPYCGQRDRRPASHISAGRCRSLATDVSILSP